MVKKKIDNRIRVMIENGVKLGHRTMFIVIGDKARDQVPILYDILTKSTVKARPTVLWCYKNKDEAISKWVFMGLEALEVLNALKPGRSPEKHHTNQANTLLYLHSLAYLHKKESHIMITAVPLQ